MKISLGADHAGFELKEKIKKLLLQQGVEVNDRGTHSSEAADHAADLGILVCGSGIGMSIVANKVAGVRAANVSSEYEAQLSREHNDANVLTLGARLISDQNAFQIVQKWLETSFAGGRHQRRVEKISEIE